MRKYNYLQHDKIAGRNESYEYSILQTVLILAQQETPSYILQI